MAFKKTTTDIESVLSDNKTNAVVITTRHDSHFDLILKSLKFGKDIYVEKPMCLNNDELEKLRITIKKFLISPPDQF